MQGVASYASKLGRLGELRMPGHDPTLVARAFSLRFMGTHQRGMLYVLRVREEIRSLSVLALSIVL